MWRLQKRLTAGFLAALLLLPNCMAWAVDDENMEQLMPDTLDVEPAKPQERTRSGRAATGVDIFPEDDIRLKEANNILMNALPEAPAPNSFRARNAEIAGQADDKPTILYDPISRALYANGAAIIISEEEGKGTYVKPEDSGVLISVLDAEGKQSSIDGSTGVEIAENTIVYGGAENNTDAIPKTKVTFESGTVSSIFGGSLYGNVTETEVIINGGELSGNGVICAGGRGSSDDRGGTYVETANLTVTSGAAKWIYGGGYYGNVGTTNVAIQGGNYEYAAGGGVHGTANKTNVTLSASANITDTVFGGGWSSLAEVTDSSTVTMNGGSVKLVYGGCYAASVGKTSLTISGGTIGAVYGGSMLKEPGTITGDTTVTLTGGEIEWVFGGSKYTEGPESTTTLTIGEGVIFNQSDEGAVYGGSQVSDVSQTNVTVNGSSIKVLYGGGQLGQVTNGTNVTVTSGSISTLYGGCGTDSSDKTAEAASSNVTVTSGDIDELYGGSYASEISGQSHVVISGGTVGSLYGGGATTLSPVGSTLVELSGGAVVDYLYGGGRDGKVNDMSKVDVTGGTVSKNLYGGGRSSAGTAAKSEVTISGGTIPHVFAGGEYGSVGTSTLTIKSEVGFACGGGYSGASKTINVNVVKCAVGTLCGGNYAVNGAENITISLGESTQQDLMVVNQLICGESAKDSIAAVSLTVKDGSVLQMYPGYCGSGKYVIDGGNIPRQYFGEKYEFFNSSGERVYTVNVTINEPARSLRNIVVTAGGKTWYSRTDSDGRLVIYLPEITFTEGAPLKVEMGGISYTNSSASIGTEANAVTVSSSSVPLEYTVEFGADDDAKGTVSATTQSGTLTSGSKVNEGTQITFTAVPKEGYTFVEWVRDGAHLSEDPTVSVTANGNMHIMARFEGAFTVTFHEATARKGTLSAFVMKNGVVQRSLETGEQVSANTTVRFVAKAMEGDTINKWLINDVETSSGIVTDATGAQNLTLSITANTVVEVEFAGTDPTYAIVVEPTTGGTINVDPKEATKDTTVTITVVPESNYTLKAAPSVTDADGIKVNVSKVEDEANEHTYQFTMPGKAVTVAAEFEKEVTHTITIAPAANGKVSVDQTGTVKAGTTVTVTAEPDEGYILSSFQYSYTLDGTDKTENVPEDGKFIMPDADVTIIAVFEKNIFIVRVDNLAGGSVELSVNGTPIQPGKPVEVGTVVTVKITPSGSNAIENSTLTYGGTSEDKGTTDQYTFTMPKDDVQISVTFKNPDSSSDSGHTISLVNASNGLISIDQAGKVMPGVTVKVTTTPADGYKLSSLSYSYTDAGTSKDEDITEKGEFTMPDADVTITAVFERQTWSVSVGRTSGGSVELSAKGEAILPGTPVGTGTEVTVKLIPSEGYIADSLSFGSLSFEDVKAKNLGNGVYTFTMPECDVTISATFKKDSSGPVEVPGHIVRIDEAGITNGTVTVSVGAGEYISEGTKVTVTARPAEGYRLGYLRYRYALGSSPMITVELAKDLANGGTFEFEMPDADVTITAGFSKNPGSSSGTDDEHNTGNTGSTGSTGSTSNSGGHTGGGGGGGGSSSGSGSGSVGGGSVTVTPADEEKPTQTPNVGGNITLTVKSEPRADGHVLVSVPYPEIEKAVKSKANGVDVRLKPYTSQNALSAEISIPMDAIRLMVNENAKSFTIDTPPGLSLRMDSTSMRQICSIEGQNIKLLVEPADGLSSEARGMVDGRPVYSVKLTVDGKAVTSFGGGILNLTIPYTPRAGEDTAFIKGCYINDEGKIEILDDSRYIAVEKAVEINTTHLSLFGVAYSKQFVSKFTDIKGHWAEDVIISMEKAGIVNGVTETEFKPESPLQRCMMITILGRMAGASTDGVEGTGFTDVPEDAYYAPYTAWAKSNGLAQGVGNAKFAPTENITREQMAVFCYRYAALQNVTIPRPDAPELFGDDHEIHSWARDAVYALRNTGILNGMDGNLYKPRSGATRAQICAVLQRLIEYIEK